MLSVEIPQCLKHMTQYDLFNLLLLTVKHDPRSHPTSGNTASAQAWAEAVTKGMDVTELQKVRFSIDSGKISISVVKESPVAVFILNAWKTAVEVNRHLPTKEMKEAREQQKAKPAYANPFASLGKDDSDFQEHEKPPCQMTKDEAEEEFPPLKKAIEVSGVTLRGMVDLNEVSSMTKAEANKKAAKKKAKKATSQHAKDEADVMALMTNLGL